MIVFASCTANSSAVSTSVTFSWLTQPGTPPDEGPSASVPARPRPAPAAPSAAVLASLL